MQNRNQRQRGFSLIEVMIALLIMTILMGVAMEQISVIQQRYKTEEAKIDTFQTAREFMDQMVRDLHNTGFPNKKMYKPNILGGSYQQSIYNAVGLVFVSPAKVQFEGDIDGDGVVDSVVYQLQTSTSGNGNANCPCVKRSAINKAAGVEPSAQSPVFNTQVENVVSTALFSFFDASGNPVSVPGAGLTKANFDPYDLTDPVNQIFTIKIQLQVQGAIADPKTGVKPQIALNSTAQIAN